MTGKTVSKTRQKQAVNRTFSLLKNGISITEAREIVADELGLSSNTLSRWQNIHGLETPNNTRITNLVRSNGAARKSSETKGVNTNHSNDSSGSFGAGLLNVYNSLLTKNGDYTNKDAGTICQVVNTALNRAKFELSVRKHVDKMNTREGNEVVKNLLI